MSIKPLMKKLEVVESRVAAARRNRLAAHTDDVNELTRSVWQLRRQARRVKK